MRHLRPALVAPLLITTALASAPLHAQPADPDPPARVGRIARIGGTVSFHPPAADHWDAAIRNYPLIAGDSLWTEPRATATLDLGGAELTLRDRTELSLDRIDPDAVAATAAQGAVCLQVQPTSDPQAADQTYTLRTPRGDVVIKQPGRYGILAGDTDAATTITVLAGSAEITAGSNTLQVSAGQAGTLTGTVAESVDAKVGPARPDPFLASACAPPSRTAAHPATTMMVGAADLDDYGVWQTAPDYGAVWYPRVPATWVPYRDGHWSYVAPWGWTWIDASPWGFAPFHYGRWSRIAGRWGWIPVAERLERPPPPVYAPALVSFIAPASGAIGWLPLGPREPFRPWYHASESYVRNVNIRQVTNVTQLNQVTINTFANRTAATSVPAAVLAQSRPVSPIARPLQAPGAIQALAALPPPPNALPRPASPGPQFRRNEPGRVPLQRAAEPGQPSPPAPAPAPLATIPLATPGTPHARPGDAILSGRPTVAPAQIPTPGDRQFRPGDAVLSGRPEAPARPNIPAPATVAPATRPAPPPVAPPGAHSPAASEPAHSQAVQPNQAIRQVRPLQFPPPRPETMSAPHRPEPARPAAPQIRPEAQRAPAPQPPPRPAEVHAPVAPPQPRVQPRQEPRPEHRSENRPERP